jgi:hypothetical protein
MARHRWAGLLLAGGEKPTLPDIPLQEPSLIERLKAERDILGFPVTDHPLALFPDVRCDSYCPIINLKDNHGKRVSIAGLVPRSSLGYLPRNPRLFRSRARPSCIALKRTSERHYVHYRWADSSIVVGP